MRFEVMVLGVVFLVAGFAGEAAARKATTGDAETDAAMVAVQKKLKAVKTCRAQVVTVLRVQGKTFEIRDQGYYQVPGRIHLDRTTVGNARQTIVSDGGLIWFYDPQDQMVTRINLARVYRATGREADADQPDPTRPFRGLKWNTIRYVGSDTLGGATLRAFEAVPTASLLDADLKMVPTKVRFFVHPADGLLRAVRYYDASGQEIISERFENVVVNPNLKDDLFEFVIPAGANVMDTTDEAIQLLKSVEEKHKNPHPSAPPVAPKSSRSTTLPSPAGGGD